ncbi:MAG: hypothetical protein FWB79_04640 [Treponema sp.]|nr:hypothetical protein [Treponema sp.]
MMVSVSSPVSSRISSKGRPFAKAFTTTRVRFTRNERSFFRCVHAQGVDYDLGVGWVVSRAVYGRVDFLLPNIERKRLSL